MFNVTYDLKWGCRHGVCMLVWLSLASCSVASAGVDPQHRYGLLVGVQSYPHLAASEQLHGSRNDVQLMSELLVDRFRFPPENIRVLLDEQATGTAIRGELNLLVQRIEALPRDTQVYVVFHFSGHGSQVYDQPSGPDADEQDGLDETIVPYDATQQGSDVDIRDDELNAFAHRICQGNASRLWMVLDCCHSGTGVRGATTTRFRALDRKLDGRSHFSGASRNVSEKTLPPGVVALYACQAEEKEPEFQDGDRTFGLLTRFMAQVLHETGDLSKLSYGLLVDTIESRYRLDRRVIPAPRPRIEGGSQKIVCGAGPEFDRAPYWRVMVSPMDSGQVSINAGSLHGVRVNSLYQVYHTAEQVITNEEASVSWLRVCDVDLTTSRANVLQREGDDWFESRLPKSFSEGFAVERYRDHGDFGARIRVVLAVDEQTDSAALTRDDPRVPLCVKEAFAKSRRDDESDWMQWADANGPFDLILRIDRTQAALFPAIAMTYADDSAISLRGESTVALRGGWGPFDLRNGTQAARQIQESIRRITRARNLIRLVDLQQSKNLSENYRQGPRLAPSAQGSRIGSKSEPEIDIQLMMEELQLSDGAIVSRQPWSSTQGGLGGEGDKSVVADGRYYDWRVTNVGDDEQPVYVTILQIDSNMGIQTIMPAQLGAESPRLRPGESLNAGGFECCRDDQGNAEFGPRWTIVISTREPNQYSWLSQDSLPRIRGFGSEGSARQGGIDSSLDKILLGELYFKTRGISSSPRRMFDPTWSIELRQWLAVSNEERN